MGVIATKPGPLTQTLPDGTVLDHSNNLTILFTEIINALNWVKGTSDKYKPKDLPEAILDIGQLSNLQATVTRIMLELGSSIQLSAVTDPENSEITWSTSDENVVSVSDTGLLTAINVGVATITASTEDSFVSWEVEVLGGGLV